MTLKRRLAKLGLETIGDLLEHVPHRYESAAKEVPIAELHGGDEVVIVGEVLNVSKRPLRGRRTLVTARITDGTATIGATWFNQPWVADQLRPGMRLRIRGKNGRYGFDVKSYDLGAARATADFAPVYPAAEEIPAKTVRRVAEAALPHVVDYFDPLPAELRERESLPLKRDALAVLHRPQSEEEAERGRQRLAFDELLMLQVAIAARAASRARTLAPSLGEPGDLIARYRRALPFALTPYQEQAIRELDQDLARTTPMHRLLQGDVGSGKTVVALYALLRAVEHGRQGALMAPTMTLAEQHFLTIADICLELGVTCTLLTGASRRRCSAPTSSSGTHALIQEGVELRDLAVAVVDEQHRFGVEQRKALTEGTRPARAAHDRDADPADARAHRVRRPRRLDDREAARVAQAGRDDVDHRGARPGDVHAADATAARRPPGLRRLPAHRAVRDERRPCGRSRGRTPAALRAARLPRRVPARAPPVRTRAAR